MLLKFFGFYFKIFPEEDFALGGKTRGLVGNEIAYFAFFRSFGKQVLFPECFCHSTRRSRGGVYERHARQSRGNRLLENGEVRTTQDERVYLSAEMREVSLAREASYFVALGGKAVFHKRYEKRARALQNHGLRVTLLDFTLENARIYRRLRADNAYALAVGGIVRFARGVLHHAENGI